MRKFTTILLIFFSTLLFGQKIDSAKAKQIEIYEKVMYGMNSEVFKKRKYYSKLDTTYKFPWKDKQYSPELLKNALDTLASNASIKVKEGAFTNLILELDSSFPNNIDQEISKIFELIIKTNSVVYQNNKTIEIEKNGNTGYGSKFSSGYKDGKSYSYNWITINKSFNIKSDVNKESLKGKLSFLSSFILDYQYIKITKSDIGKQFKIGSYDFKVIDFFDNKVILDFNKDVKISEFNSVNTDKNGNKISQIPLFEFHKMKENNNNIPSDAKSLPHGTQTMYKTNYELFKSSPNLTFDQYRKNVHEKFVKMLNSEKPKEAAEKIWGKKYIIFSTSDYMQNFYLYLPKNRIEKEFELTID